MVAGGGIALVVEVVVTMRGRRVARLVPVDEVDPWQTCAPAAWFASRRRLAVRARDEPGSRPPGPCPPRRRPTALIVYFDTSALVKLIFDEPGSELAVELWDRAYILVSSQLIYPEARAALAAAARGCRIGESTHVSAVATLEDL